MSKKVSFKDSLVVGFALFAMFFGAGNLIFPPYLGFGSADNWFWGFLAFIVTDIGLSIFALMMIAKLGKGFTGITDVLGKKASTAFLIVNTICLGPLIAIPRTAATTFEFGVQPIFPSVNSWVSSIVFFVIVVLLCLKQAKIIDVIGTFLSPIMLIALGLLIVKGIITPLGTPAVGPHIPSVLKEGIMAGYQTMDMLGTIIISVAVLSSITQKGYNSQKSQFKMIGFSGLVSAIALFAVYCGLSFLGASVSTVFEAHLTQAELLIAITKGVLGHEGVILLGIIVAFACLTTAIGLVSSASAYFANVSKGKLSYKHLVIAISAFSCIISNLGISKIIEFAAPILSLLYPILVVLTVMALFSNKIKNNNIYRGAALGALVTSIVALTENIFKLNLGIKYLPFNSFGFEWILPAIIGGIIGVFIKEKHSLQSN